MEITSLEKLIPLLCQNKVKRFIKGDLHVEFGFEDYDEQRVEIDTAVHSPKREEIPVSQTPPQSAPILGDELMQFDQVLHWSSPGTTEAAPLPLTGESTSQTPTQASQ